MTTKPSPSPDPDVQQGYEDTVRVFNQLNTAGSFATKADVREMHVLWLSVPPALRHLAAVSFHRFDNQNDIFGRPAEEADLDS